MQINKSTNQYKAYNFQKKSAIWMPISLLMLILSLMLSLCFSDEISHAVLSGLSLCQRVIIPSVYPFMIIADLIAVTVDFSSLRLMGSVFERIFKISRAGMSAFFLGIICGFPLGVKHAHDLYINGKITKEELERLIGFSNNTGPAFLVSGIGLGLRGNIAEGILLYISMCLAAILVGALFGIGKSIGVEYESEERSTYTFSLTESIKSAGQNTLTVCSFLTFFSCLCGTMRKLLGQSYPYIFIISFLEVGNATSILSKTPLLGDLSSLVLSAFAVGFSGFSVHLQALSFLHGSNISTKKYFLMKLLQGIFAAGIICILHEMFL